MKGKLLFWLPIFIWIVIGIYGIFYNITYIDEAKYLIKGWLITTRQIGYYSTPEFFYQHMPGVMLWYGIGQKFFGPSLLIARLQSFFIGLLVLWFSYKLAGRKILPLLVLAPAAILYYSAAVPQSLAALMLILGFYCLFKKKDLLATIFFTLTFIVRENFLFTLIIYLLWQRKGRLKHWLTALIVAIIIIVPGLPGTINVLKNLPGVSSLLPIPKAEQLVLDNIWMRGNFSGMEYFLAVKEFGIVYISFAAMALWSFLSAAKQKKLWPEDRRWRLLIIITGFNLLAHAWSAFNLSPRAIIPYFTYVFPLTAVIISRFLPTINKTVWFGLLGLALAGLQFASLYQPPNRPNTIGALNYEAETIKPLVQDKDKILWLADPMVLYLSGQLSYYPLINNTNYYKEAKDTATVKRLGFWNQEMLTEWLKEADLAVIDKKGINLISQNVLTDYVKIPSPIINLNFYEPNIKN